jgi:hypothetical protein
MKSSRNSQCPEGCRGCETSTGASNASARISPVSVTDFTLPTAVSMQKFGPTLERRSEFFGRMSDSLAEVFGQPSMEIIYIRLQVKFGVSNSILCKVCPGPATREVVVSVTGFGLP